MGEVKADVRATVLQEIDLITNTPLECWKRYMFQHPEIPVLYEVWLGFGSCAVDSFGRIYPKAGNRSICLGDSGSSIFWLVILRFGIAKRSGFWCFCRFS